MGVIYLFCPLFWPQSTLGQARFCPQFNKKYLKGSMTPECPQKGDYGNNI